MKKHRDATAKLRAYCALCGGQKAAAVKLGVSPQFIGQLFHGVKPVPDEMIAYIEGRPIPAEDSASLPIYRRRIDDNSAP